jgi:hypothetical protein
MKYKLFPLESLYKIERSDLDQDQVFRALAGEIHTKKMRVFRLKYDGKVDQVEPDWEIGEDPEFSVYLSTDLTTPIDTGSITVTDLAFGYELSFLIDTTDLDAGSSYVYALTLQIGADRLIVPYYVDIITLAFPYGG